MVVNVLVSNSGENPQYQFKATTRTFSSPDRKDDIFCFLLSGCRPVTHPVARCDELSAFKGRRLQLRSPPGAGDADRHNMLLNASRLTSALLILYLLLSFLSAAVTGSGLKEI